MTSQAHYFIAERKEREKAVRMEAQGTMFDTKLGPTQVETGGFPACKHCRGMTKSWHKPEHIGKRNSRGKVYDGHIWEAK